jgi:hypothetical protein
MRGSKVATDFGELRIRYALQEYEAAQATGNSGFDKITIVGNY